MITVTEAKNIILANSSTLPTIQLPLGQAAGYILAQDVFALTDIPPFDQSAMDGYAFNFEDYVTNKKLNIEGEIPAGHDQPIVIQPQQAIRIYTGSVMPAGANTVVMQEKVVVQQKELVIEDPQI
ncbi:MAG: molybdopterin molybdenumtransferase MoeA, partial [Sphingobacteriales bacterium]|nr:molybdopterin molybdenumtransferase MoeA [Sphingobacteriales bacterium]